MITELVLGGLLLHTTPQPDQINQLQMRPMLIAKSGPYSVLVGQNSIGDNIWGLGVDYPLSESYTFKLGFYRQDGDKFKESAARHFYGDTVPIVGIEHKHELTKELGVSTTFTPAIVFSGIFLRF